MGKNRIKILVFLVSTIAASQGNADFGTGNVQWRAVTGKNAEERILYDPGSVVPSGPGLFRVRIMDFDQHHMPRKSVEEFDCTNRIVRDIEVVTETPHKANARVAVPSEWRGVTKDSPRGELFRILCR